MDSSNHGYIPLTTVDTPERRNHPFKPYDLHVRAVRDLLLHRLPISISSRQTTTPVARPRPVQVLKRLSNCH